nr:nuclear ribonuclease Z-like [Ipomoea batatas]
MEYHVFSGEEICLRKDLKVRAFKTYHVIPSQGYIVYSIKHKLKQEYIGLPAEEIKKLKSSCVEIVKHADILENKAILLIHFSARYQLDVIQEAISALPPPLAGRVFALTEGF